MWCQTCTEAKSVESSISIEKLSNVFGKSRQAYYQMLRRRDSRKADEEIVLHHVRERRKVQPKEGTRKLLYNLQEIFEQEKIQIGRDKFFTLLGERNLLVKRRRKGKRTTNSNHPFYKYPNLVKGLEIDRADTVWACDITYIPFRNSFAYLSLITDLYSHKIVGHCLHKDLKTEGPLKALKGALKRRMYPERDLIHHSDKGIQYCSYIYTNLLRSKDIEISMAEAGNPYENAVAERVNGILKDEFNLEYNWCNAIDELDGIIDNAIWIYNNIRSHASCDYLTPEEAHKKTGILNKRWAKKPQNV